MRHLNLFWLRFLLGEQAALVCLLSACLLGALLSSMAGTGRALGIILLVLTAACFIQVVINILLAAILGNRVSFILLEKPIYQELGIPAHPSPPGGRPAYLAATLPRVPV
jgi:hypothetical protein